MKQTKMMKITTCKSIPVLMLIAVFSISVFADGAIWATEMGEFEYMKHTGTSAVFSNEKSGGAPVTWFFINSIGSQLPDRGSYSGYWIDNSGRQMCEASLVDPNGKSSQNWGRFEITFQEDGSYPVWTGTLGDCFKQPGRVLKAAKPKDIENISTGVKEGMLYADARKIFMSEGWKPVNSKSDSSSPGEDEVFNAQTESVRKEFAEVLECAPTGRAPCIFQFSGSNNKTLWVYTIGESDQTVTSWEIE
jgi:hypothetical protein